MASSNDVMQEMLLKYKDGVNPQGLNPEILNVIQKLKVPATLTSGYRSPELNSSVGGAPNSAHTLGNAVDFRLDPNTEGPLLASLQNSGLNAKVHTAGTAPHIHASLGGQSGSTSASLGGPSGSTSASLPLDKKNTFKDKILPLLFRFGLPALAGGVMGAKHPMGAFGGALGGLARGGLGYLGDQNIANQNEASNATDFQKALLTSTDKGLDRASNERIAGDKNAAYSRYVDAYANNQRDKNNPLKGLRPEWKQIYTAMGGKPIVTDADKKMFKSIASTALLKGKRTGEALATQDSWWNVRPQELERAIDTYNNIIKNIPGGDGLQGTENITGPQQTDDGLNYELIR